MTMRWASRLFLTISAIFLIPLFFLTRKTIDLWDQYSLSAYIRTSINNGPQAERPPVPARLDDKIVVMAKLEQENTNWVAEYLPEYVLLAPSPFSGEAFSKTLTEPLYSWQHAIYTVNPSTHPPTRNSLITPHNKGHESMAYLTYIIDNYASLPSIVAFIHSHASGFLSAWHTDTPLHSNVDSLNSLQLPFVQQNGYVNLRCNWNPGCLPTHRYNKHVTPQIWRDIFANASISQFSQRNNASFVPEKVGIACCAQFAVSKERLLERPRKDYEVFRDWVTTTGKNDAQSGRVMEFLWHVMFGMNAV